MKKAKLGLVQGRHFIKGVTDYVFPYAITDVTDFEYMDLIVHRKLQDVDYLDLYVTGLSVALARVIDYCHVNHIQLTLWHYNTDFQDYYPDQMSSGRNIKPIGSRYRKRYGAHPVDIDRAIHEANKMYA